VKLLKLVPFTDGALAGVYSGAMTYALGKVFASISMASNVVLCPTMRPYKKFMTKPLPMPVNSSKPGMAKSCPFNLRALVFFGTAVFVTLAGLDGTGGRWLWEHGWLSYGAGGLVVFLLLLSGLFTAGVAKDQSLGYRTLGDTSQPKLAGLRPTCLGGG